MTLLLIYSWGVPLSVILAWALSDIQLKSEFALDVFFLFGVLWPATMPWTIILAIRNIYNYYSNNDDHN